MDIDFELLGDQIVRDIAGADSPGGFDWASGISALSEVAQKGVAYQQDKSKAEKAKADDATSLAKSLSADISWANAEASLDLAQQGKDQQRIAAAQSLQQVALQAASGAGAALSTDSTAKRVKAAQDQLQKASQASLGAPSDMAKAATMRAWQKVSTMAGLGGSAALDTGKHHGGGGAPSGGGSFLTKMAGPLPVWGWGLGAVAVVGGLMYFMRKR